MAGCLLVMGLASCEMKNEILGKEDGSSEMGLLNLGVAVDAKNNDVQTKAKNAIKFLQGGDKVKVSIRFRGRQITHTEIGLKVMQDFVDRTKDVAVVEKRPSLEGRHMIMILGPKADKPVKGDKAKAAQSAPAAE